MKCFFCGNDLHEFKCPMISAYEYGEDMKIKRIEFITFADILKNLPEDHQVSILPEHNTRQ